MYYYTLFGAFTRPVALRLTLLFTAFLDVVAFRFAGRLFIGFCSSPLSPPNFTISIAPCFTASFKLDLFVNTFLAALLATFIARFPAAFKIFFPTGTMARLIIGAAIRKRPRNSPPIPCPRTTHAVSFLKRLSGVGFVDTTSILLQLLLRRIFCATTCHDEVVVVNTSLRYK